VSIVFEYIPLGSYIHWGQLRAIADQALVPVSWAEILMPVMTRARHGELWQSQPCPTRGRTGWR
jgi:hypothetical protein